MDDLDALTECIQARGWVWDVGVLRGGYEARIWDWPHLLGRARSDTKVAMYDLLMEAMQEAIKQDEKV